jgi:hypothetical protein
MKTQGEQRIDKEYAQTAYQEGSRPGTEVYPHVIYGLPATFEHPGRDQKEEERQQALQ